jgi:hypothetical protein
MEDILINIYENDKNFFELSIKNGSSIRELLNFLNLYKADDKIPILHNKIGNPYYLDYIINKSMNFYV